MADDLLCRNPRDSFGRPVEERNPAFEIYREDTVRNTIQDSLELRKIFRPFLRSERRVLVLRERAQNTLLFETGDQQGTYRRKPHRLKKARGNRRGNERVQELEERR